MLEAMNMGSESHKGEHEKGKNSDGGSRVWGKFECTKSIFKGL